MKGILETLMAEVKQQREINQASLSAAKAMSAHLVELEMRMRLLEKWVESKEKGD